MNSITDTVKSFTCYFLKKIIRTNNDNFRRGSLMVLSS